MEDLLKRYYAHPTARERALFLAEYAAEPALAAEERETIELLSLLPDFLIEPISENPRFPALLSAEWRDFADTLFRSCLRDPAYRSRVFGLVPVPEEMIVRRLREGLHQIMTELPARFSLQRESSVLRAVMEESLSALTAS